MYIPIYVIPECAGTSTSTCGGSVIAIYFHERYPHQYPADEGGGEVGGGVPFHRHGAVVI